MSDETPFKQAIPHARPTDSNSTENPTPFAPGSSDTNEHSAYSNLNPPAPSFQSSSLSQLDQSITRKSNSLPEIQYKPKPQPSSFSNEFESPNPFPQRKPLPRNAPAFPTNSENSKIYPQNPPLSSISDPKGPDDDDIPVIQQASQIRLSREARGPRIIKHHGKRLSTIKEQFSPPLPPLAPTRAPPPLPRLPDHLEYEPSYEHRHRPLSMVGPPPPIPQRRRVPLGVGAASVPGAPGESVLQIDPHKYPMSMKSLPPSHQRGAVSYPSYDRRHPAPRPPRNSRHEVREDQNFRRHDGRINLDGYVALNREDAEWYLLICRKFLCEDVGGGRGAVERRGGMGFRSMDGVVAGGDTLRERRLKTRREGML